MIKMMASDSFGNCNLTYGTYGDDRPHVFESLLINVPHPLARAPVLPGVIWPHLGRCQNRHT